MRPNAITVMTPITGNRPAVEEFLRARGDGIQDGPSLLFTDIRQLHSLSFFIVEGVNGNPPWLVLEANFDGARREFVRALVDNERALLEGIYRECAGYPRHALTQADDVVRYLEGHAQTELAYYVGCPEHTTGRVADEAAIAAQVGVLLQQPSAHARRSDLVQSIGSMLPAHMRESLRAVRSKAVPARAELGNLLAWLGRGAMRAIVTLGVLMIAVMLVQALGVQMVPTALVRSTATWALWLVGILASLACVACGLRMALIPRHATDAVKSTLRRRAIIETLQASVRAVPGFAVALGLVALLAWQGALLVSALLALVIVVALVIVIAFTVMLVHARNERQEPEQELVWDAEREAQMRKREDRGPQNHFAGVTTVKDTPLRLLTVRAVLLLVNVLARFVDARRGLAGIKSIHFARWTVLPRERGTRERRLLFIAHYDGSWAGYLGDFVAHAPRGMTAIWGNTRGCPRHGFSFSGGVRDEQRFKCYARRSQVESLLWYSRYPSLTVGAIQRHAAICNVLSSAVTATSGSPTTICEADIDAFFRMT